MTIAHLAKQFGGSPLTHQLGTPMVGCVWMEYPSGQGGKEPGCTMAPVVLFLEENGWNSPGTSDPHQRVDYRWRTGSAAINQMISAVQ